MTLIDEGCPLFPSRISVPRSITGGSTFNFVSSLIAGTEESLISSNLVQCFVSFCDYNIRNDCYDLPVSSIT